MGEANILIAGMRGLGVEVAHNVILSGVKSVTVQDEGQVLWEHLSSQVAPTTFLLCTTHALITLVPLKRCFVSLLVSVSWA